MKITLPLINPAFDDQRLSNDLKQDFHNMTQIYIYKDEADWANCESSHAFSVWIEYGKENQLNAIMFEVDLNDLEMFANSLQKSIDMLRIDYNDILKGKIKKGDCL